eukprot:TRINITY_DN6616_c0_g2_i1.p1 TRINITY_DN6616_c0_g2~~TRINITY_DN6616_c0_g2_i1.p1  ORF type:complete len:183 (+),score=25.16 TRINITY_DN6616_c0_g2_i1:2-550(+)
MLSVQGTYRQYMTNVGCGDELHGQCFSFFFFQAEDGIRDVERSRGLGDVYKRQLLELFQKEVFFLLEHIVPLNEDLLKNQLLLEIILYYLFLLIHHKVVSTIHQNSEVMAHNQLIIQLFFLYCIVHFQQQHIYMHHFLQDQVQNKFLLHPMYSALILSLIHISEPTRPLYISYAVFCLKKKK